ncbi:caspase recruitment domain-containing protein 10 isoform X1 [Rhinatrema bivittatum]|uniref:caspase recruitment domain-containing protein 10 isoform X1 n=1 Tax=Rhinatrema bivittatum TaxID=194408 RepID=UPI001126D497|nr:caspase recruitment domain-containing protein 10 isoform X1 [Rhinatrema bivittatum]XP_029445913.1 caspase recruitment domain-containing protein 10 isoform X1 [Rhinatrema bivittatum]
MDVAANLSLLSPAEIACDPGQVGSSALEKQDEETLWEKIEGVRHMLTRSLNPAKLTPYLRQCRVIDEQDEEEVLNACRFPSKAQQTGRLMDILRGRGKRGYEALLESLEFYYPQHFSRLTGLKPVQRCSMILDEEGPEGLTQFLMAEVRKQRLQMKERLAWGQQLLVQNQGLAAEKAGLEQRVQDLLHVQERYRTLRDERDQSSLELQRLKDENYTLALRYAQLSEEKSTAMLRSRDLQLQLDQLKCQVSSLHEECSLIKKRSTKLRRDLEEKSRDSQRDKISSLQAENQRLKASLQELQSTVQAGNVEVPTAERILLDVWEYDCKEAEEQQQELCEKMNALQDELQHAEHLRDKYLHEVEDLQLQHQSLQRDCELYRLRMNTVLGQLQEIEKERDQAIQGLDQLQLRYSQSLLEKDEYRKKVRALEEERDELQSRLHRMGLANGRVQEEAQQSRGKAMFAADPPSLDFDLVSSWILFDGFSKQKDQCLARTPGERSEKSVCTCPKPCVRSALDGWSKSSDLKESCSGSDEFLPAKGIDAEYEKEVNRLSTFPFPPGPDSLRRKREQDTVPLFKSFSCDSMDRKMYGTGILPPSVATSSSMSFNSLFSTRKSETKSSVSSESGTFLCRPLIISLPGPSPPSTLQPAHGQLGSDISILGGNRTGIFVAWVKPGSRAEAAGLSEGCRLLELRGSSPGWDPLPLDSCTKEVAHLSLQHWDDPAALTFQADSNGYQALKMELKKRAQLSGDSFYVRTNLDILVQHEAYLIRVKAQEILHILDTMYRGRLEWHCARVNRETQKDLVQGVVPNFSRAQQLMLIQQNLGLVATAGGGYKTPKNMMRKCNPENLQPPKNKTQADSKKLSLSSPWPSQDEEEGYSLKPYSLLWPRKVQKRRPVIFSPPVLARGLIRGLLELHASQLDFNVCLSEIINEEEFVASRRVVLVRSIPPDQMECVRISFIQDVIQKNKHCLLELRMQGVRDLIKNDIVPIVIHVRATEKNIKKLRSLAAAPQQSEVDFLRLCHLEAEELACLPYPCASLEPQSWSRLEDLVKALRGRIFQEQGKVVWIEQDKL